MLEDKEHYVTHWCLDLQKKQQSKTETSPEFMLATKKFAPTLVIFEQFVHDCIQSSVIKLKSKK